MQLVKALVSAHDELASWRQHLHQNPEIAYEEKDTSDFVAAKLESFGVEVHRGFGGKRRGLAHAGHLFRVRFG